MNKLIPIMLLILLVIPLVPAIQTFKHNVSAQLCHEVRLNDGIASGILCNITISYSNNGSNLVDFLKMDDVNDEFCYNLTGTDTSVKGFYDYGITCSNGVENQTDDFQYLVNLGGIEPSQQRTDSLSRTIWTFFGLGVLFFIGLFFVKSFPVKLTLFLLMLWLFLMGINTSFISIQDEVVNENIEGFLSFFLALSFQANYFIFLTIIILWMITIIVTMVGRKKRKKEEQFGF